MIVSQKVLDYVDRKLSENVFYFGSAGASLTREKSLGSFKASMGLNGERKTSKIIQEFVKTHPYCVLVDSVHIKTVKEITGQTINYKDSDHVVIMGDRLIVIDTKNWKNSCLYTIQQDWTVKRNNRRFAGGSNVHLLEAKQLFRKTFNTNPVMILCVNGTDIRLCRNVLFYKAPYRMCDSEGLYELLEKIYDKIKPNKYDKELIAKIVVCAIKPKNSYKDMLKEFGLTRI